MYINFEKKKKKWIWVSLTFKYRTQCTLMLISCCSCAVLLSGWQPLTGVPVGEWKKRLVDTQSSLKHNVERDPAAHIYTREYPALADDKLRSTSASVHCIHVRSHVRHLLELHELHRIQCTLVWNRKKKKGKNSSTPYAVNLFAML